MSVMNIGDYARDFFGEYDDTDITIKQISDNGFNEFSGEYICTVKMSNGDCWLCDCNGNYRVNRFINPANVKFDEFKGWIYKNGKPIKWL